MAVLIALKQLDICQNVIPSFFFNPAHYEFNILLIKYNEYFISTVGTDGLVLKFVYI